VDRSFIDHPLKVDGSGRVATTAEDDHIRDMIYQVLFTNPGERVNRPDFGCGLLQLVFMPNSAVLAAATQHTIQGALGRWLGDVIQVERAEVQAEDAKLQIEIIYRRFGEPTTRRVEFATPAGT
jgi:uncharacterized protein